MLPALRRLIVPAVAALALVGLSGCTKTVGATSTKSEPFTLEKVEGTELQRLRLLPEAVERLGVQTAAVGDLTVPYAAVLYEAKGTTFVYTNPEPLVFVRQPITVERITDGRAVLITGPPPGTLVVTVGGAELNGIEFGVGK